jgi:hypothetical protein
MVNGGQSNSPEKSRLLNYSRRAGPIPDGRPRAPAAAVGAPLCCDVEFIEVQNQRQPLLALCVLEKAALRAGIVLRLESCPQEHCASWLTLEGIGRIFVEREDGLVRVNLSVGDADGYLILGSSTPTAEEARALKTVGSVTPKRECTTCADVSAALRAPRSSVGSTTVEACSVSCATTLCAYKSTCGRTAKARCIASEQK